MGPKAERRAGAQGWPRAYLTPHVQGQQAWLKQGGGPQQQVGGWRCPHLPQRVADHDDLAEVESVSEPLAFGLVQDPLVVVIPARRRESRRSDGPGQAPRRTPARPPPRPQASHGVPAVPTPGGAAVRWGPRTTALRSELCTPLT